MENILKQTLINMKFIDISGYLYPLKKIKINT